MNASNQIAILYQAQKPPVVNGVRKPMKEGGYSDSGADIAFALKKNKHSIITPTSNPDPYNNFEWVFPDTKAGIESALDKGGNILWLNTVLFKDHPIESFLAKGIEIVGQIPKNVEVYDDKFYTNQELKKIGLPIPDQALVSKKTMEDFPIDIPYPLVIKPIRGRGSQGVMVVGSLKELRDGLTELFESNRFGDSVYIEEYLPGEEITITVMPPGKYQINHQIQKIQSHWCLPAVRRFNHQNGIAPYSGKVAVMGNSEVMNDEELASDIIQRVYRDCQKAGEMVGAKAPIRIDGRANQKGEYYLFDLNMKPNMTGPGRAHRNGQDSLTALAARKMNWNYDELIINVLHQKWKMPLIK